MLSAEAGAQSAAESKLQKTKQDLETRAEKLHEEAMDEELQGQLIEYNLDVVDEGTTRWDHIRRSKEC